MQGPNMLNAEIARSRVEDGVRRAELARAVGAAKAARRSAGNSRTPWAVVASAFRRGRVPASDPTSPSVAVAQRGTRAVAGPA